MPFNSALQPSDYTKLRNKWFGEQFALLCPNTPVFQCQPLANSVGVYASIEYTNVTIGAFGDVETGQAFIVTESPSDFSDVLFRGRIRKEADANFLFVTENGFALTTSYYITVIDTYDIAPKIPRPLSNGEVRIDFDLTYQDLPPIVNNLQSSYVLNTTSASGNLTFNPTATAIADGATISSWLWNLDDGTPTSGTINDQNISVSFPSGHRWVKLTVTDSNGTSNYYMFEVWIVDLSDTSNLPSDVYRMTQCDINLALDSGINAGVSLVEDVTVITNTRITIATIDSYAGDNTPITTNIDFVGYLQSDSQNIIANEFGFSSGVQFVCNGFYDRLALIPSIGITLVNNNSPSEWGQVIAPTPNRAVAFWLAYLSTFTHLSAIEFSSDLDEYVYSSYESSERTIVDALGDILGEVNAHLNYAPSGESSVFRNAMYLSTGDRNALTTVANIDEIDYSSADIQDTYNTTIDSVLVGASKYNTSGDFAVFYTARAPSISLGTGYEVAQLNSQILRANLTEDASEEELEQRAGNHLAYINPSPELSLTLNDQWHFITPTYYQWWTVVVDSAKNPRNTAYDSSTRWLMTSASISTDFDNGRKSVTAQFREETVTIGASIVVAQSPLTTDTPIAPLPVVNEYQQSLGTNPLINYPTDTPSDLDLQPIDNGSVAQTTSPLPPEQIANEQASNQPNTETIALPYFASGAVGTSFLSVLGQPYTFRISGDALIGGTSPCNSEFNNWQTLPLGDDNGWDGYKAGSGNLPLDNTDTPLARTSNGWETIIPFNECAIIKEYSPAITPQQINATCQQVSNNSGGLQIYIDTGSGWQLVESVFWSFSPNTSFSISWDNVSNLNIQRVQIGLGSGNVAYITSTDIICSDATGESRGDAFYTGYEDGNEAQLYGVGQGLLIDGGGVIAPPYNANHEYTYNFTGTGNQIVFSWVDPDGDYTNNSLNNMYIQISGAGIT